MNHQEIQELLPWYINGTLNDRERPLVDQHLRECADCQHELAEQSEWAAMLKEQPLPAHADVLSQTLQDIIASGEPRQREVAETAEAPSNVVAFPSKWNALLAAAAVFAFGILGYQNLVVLPELNNQVHQALQPRALRAIALAEPVRGIEPTLTVAPQESLFLELFHPEDQPAYPSYQFELRGPQRSAVTEPMSAPMLGEKYQLDFRTGWAAGSYTLTLKGINGTTVEEVATYTFTLQ